MLKVNVAKVYDLLKSKFGDSSDDVINKIRVGDTVEVKFKVALKPKVERRLTAAEKQLLKQKLEAGYTKEQLEEQAMQIQTFKGVVIGIHGEGKQKRIRVRKVGANEIGVERVFPVNAPVIVSIKRVRTARARRAKLYYLRERKGKKRLYVKYREDKTT